MAVILQAPNGPDPLLENKDNNEQGMVLLTA